jgi:pilus assembly protein CpaB
VTRRLVAVVVALALAVVGALVVLSYVAGADRRAMEGLEPTSVLEVVEPVPAGTPAEELGERVATTDLPASAVAEGAVADVEEISGQVSTVELRPGEQVLAARFSDPETFEATQEVEVPEDAHLVSVLLDPSRVLGGFLEPGDTVAVFGSMIDPPETRLVVNRVLVTRVQGGVALPAEQAPPAEGEPAPEGPAPEAAAPPSTGIMVTLALEVGQAEEVVFVSEHGSVWLSIQPEEADEGGERIVDREAVFQ